MDREPVSGQCMYRGLCFVSTTFGHEVLDERNWDREGGVESLVGEQERGQIKRARMYIYYFNAVIK